MLNANGNYIGFGNPKLLQVTGNNESFQQDGYQVIKFFYESGSLVSGNGTGSFTLPESKEVEFLVVGGGGTGGVPRRGGSYNAGVTEYLVAAAGGGAGSLLTGSFFGLKGMQYDVIVGAGGFRQYGSAADPSTDPARNGAPSILSGISAQGVLNIVAPGGGAGGSVTINSIDATNSGSNGGSGGGAAANLFPATNTIGLATEGLGVSGSGDNSIIFSSFQNKGGLSVDSGEGVNTFSGLGGGGGASEAGGDGSVANIKGGNGGSGSFNAMSASGDYFAGGGSGGYLSEGNGYYGLAGVGGGGGPVVGDRHDAVDFETGKGKEQTGGGGAAAYPGGSGVIIVRYKLSGFSLS